MNRTRLLPLFLAFFLMLGAMPALAQTPTLDAAKEAQSAEPNTDNSETEVPKHLASPRDTLSTFLESMNRVETDRTDEAAWERIYSTLEIPKSAGSARKEVAWQLLGVFNSLGKIDPQTMTPGVDEIKTDKLKNFEFFPDNPRPAAQKIIKPALSQLGEAPSSVIIHRVDSGAWKFAGESLDQIPQLYGWISERGVRYGLDIRQRSASAWIRSMVPGSLKGRFVLGMEAWQWLGLLGLAFICVCIDLTARVLISPVAKRLVNRYLGAPDDDLLKTTVRPMGFGLGAAAFLLLVNLLGLSGMALTVLVVAARVVLVVCITWAAWMMTDLLAAAFMRRASKTDSTFDDMIIPLLRKTVKLFIVAIGLIYVADSFDIELLPLLGSLGLAGLAISFAAQDMVKNLFGGLSIFMDRPFKVGERIVYKGYDGVIEEIGFRITRMRTLTGHLVTIPNGGITNDPIENIGRRPYIRRTINVTITYDTPAEKIQQAVQIIKDILEEPGIAEPIHGRIGADEFPPRVYFNDYNAASLNIFVIYWHFPPAYWEYMEHGEKFNQRLFEEYAKAEIEFAFPTQTLYLAGDPNRPLSVGLENLNPTEGSGG
ncbi:mechanosensitive ion channel family protein [Planctomycetales bacterium ZRK34]|nr:mechanosensitive ion channel family protein [Planctomycetales bacterium ZRK34]